MPRRHASQRIFLLPMSTVLTGALLACGSVGAPLEPEALGQKEAALIPSDPLFSSQSWHYNAIHAPAAWGRTTGNDSVSIAVLDSGRLAHPDMNTKWTGGYDFFAGDSDPTDEGLYHHGIHVAGTIGASANNGIGGAGLCWNCRLLPIRVAQQEGSFGSGSPGAYEPLSTILARAIRYSAGYLVDDGLFNYVQAPSRASVINISMGNVAGPCPADLQVAVNDANAAGTPVVVAAGNWESEGALNTTAFSAFMWSGCTSVISVAAVNQNGVLEPYSARGPGITIGAPGGGAFRAANSSGGFGELIGCTDPNETRGVGTHGVVSSWTTSQGTHCYRHWAGTSMAAPHVSGVIGLMLSRNPALTSLQVRDILQKTATPISCTNNGCGAGLLNADGAVAAATFDVSIACESASGSFVCYANPEGGIGPFTAMWTGMTRANIAPSHVNNPDYTSGTCTPNNTSTVQLSFTDALGRNVVRSKQFYCNLVTP
ncbi:S8 family serine peptidase [Myxococcus sp. NMCA1]|uniref:S8 family serine peptidase n=1 Tax=Myxococcus sp. NMCA1 TaxID=2996785 RepID=UPI00228575C5|nr:S8 family serine peptidase [Myxococcus sp. NMCA1]WAM25217.1 S8 family serine peptidase [Myxococcus sp. NMCA1]